MTKQELISRVVESVAYNAPDAGSRACVQTWGPGICSTFMNIVEAYGIRACNVLHVVPRSYGSVTLLIGNGEGIATSAQLTLPYAGRQGSGSVEFTIHGERVYTLGFWVGPDSLSNVCSSLYYD